MECVEFPQVQYIDLSEMVRVLKAVAIVSCEHLNLWTIFVICHLLCALTHCLQLIILMYFAM